MHMQLKASLNFYGGLIVGIALVWCFALRLRIPVAGGLLLAWLLILGALSFFVRWPH
jgi:hypothetical protein